MPSGADCVKFPVLENGRHNTWPCELWRNPTLFQSVISAFCALCRYGVLANLSVVRRRGGLGEPTRPCIYGKSPTNPPLVETNQYPVDALSSDFALHSMK